MVKKEETIKNKIVKFGENQLKEEQGVGMRNIDPLDIRPPSILLVQGLSDVSLMLDKNGSAPKIGQYFHSGRLEIFDNFECYFLYAAKSSYIDRRHPEEGEKYQYKAIGAMADDLSTFAMTFKGSAVYTMSTLFTASVGLKRPMYSIKIKMETKELQNEKGTWKIPVIRLVKEDADFLKYEKLSQMAKAIDRKFKEESPEIEEEDTQIVKDAKEVFKPPEKGKAADDIPF